MPKKRIMVVEDDAIIAMNIKSSLQHMRYSVTSIVDAGEDVVERVKKDRPDLILMDIILKGKIDGIEASEKIRSQFNIPIVYLTAHSDESMMKRIKRTEPLGYITKPFDESELRIVVEIALYKYEMEQKLKKHKNELEIKVTERTSELEEIIERLQNAEKTLRSRSNEISESNIALKVLLKQRVQDRKEFENNMLSNIKHLIMPYIEKLKRSRPISDELTYLNIVESNLKNIISPFSVNLSFQYLEFTPREIMVADLIRDGKQDKDILEILNISPDTVKAHRKSIRKKLGINNKKINLRTKLLSLSK